MSQNPNWPGFIGESSQGDGQGGSLIKTLRRFRQPRTTPERCELCNVGLSPNHRHVLEMSKTRIVCTCDPCALRFQDVVGGRFKLILGIFGICPNLVFRMSSGRTWRFRLIS